MEDYQEQIDMSIMLQSSKAHDRSLGDWFESIRKGHVKLPRFQRMEAWDKRRIESFLNTVIHNLPVGVALILEVGDEEKFVSRYISSAEPTQPEKVSQHLLDGQQRVTAFWRAMHNNYEGQTFFVHVREFDEYWGWDTEADSSLTVFAQNRWQRGDGKKGPLWTDKPTECLRRGLIPMECLCPGDRKSFIEDWIEEATQQLKPVMPTVPTQPELMAEFQNELLQFTDKQRLYDEKIKKLNDVITVLRERVSHFNLPYLSLPCGTSKQVALEVFINMNTNSKPLSMYDIIVAEVESITGKSLHDQQQELRKEHPAIERYFDIGQLILTTSALLQDKLPNQRGMLDMDKKVVVENWGIMERGLAKMADFLARQGVHDRARLPTNAVLAVIAASYALIPENGDKLGWCENLLQRYLWSSFFTDRYENAAATRALNDYRALNELLRSDSFDESRLSEVPALNREEFPLADCDQLVAVGWPKNENIRARGILAVATNCGALDFADGVQASYESVQKREYHHIFPDALLKEAEIESYKALNCALITWKTNRTIGRKDPYDYLEERVGHIDRRQVEHRLKTHLIPAHTLSAASYEGMNGEERLEKIRSDFNQFLRLRAEWMVEAAQRLARGEYVHLNDFMDSQA